MKVRCPVIAKREDVQVQGWCLVGLGRGFHARKRFDALRETAERIEAHSARHGEPFALFTRLSWLLLPAVDHLHRGEAAAAVDWLRRAVEMVRDLGRPNQHDFLSGSDMLCAALAHPSLAALPSLPELPEWRRLARRNLQRFSRIYPIGQPRLWMRIGEEAARRGEPRDAVRALRKSVAAARRLSMPYDEACAASALARLLPPGAPERERLEARNRELLDGLGLTADAASC